MKIVYIHGANATGDSFNYIRHHIKHKNEYVIEYDSNDGFHNNLLSMKEQLKDYKDIFFIGHSLGGIYALHLSEYLDDKVLGACTLSTPYNGCESAEYIKHFFPHHRLFRDIGPNSDPIKLSKKIEIKHSWTNIISIVGSNPLILSSNDGVVTIDSMKYRSDMELIDLSVNHYEIVLSSKTIDIIKDKIKGVK